MPNDAEYLLVEATLIVVTDGEPTTTSMLAYTVGTLVDADVELE